MCFKSFNSSDIYSSETYCQAAALQFYEGVRAVIRLSKVSCGDATRLHITLIVNILQRHLIVLIETHTLWSGRVPSRVTASMSIPRELPLNEQ